MLRRRRSNRNPIERELESVTADSSTDPSGEIAPSTDDLAVAAIDPSSAANRVSVRRRLRVPGVQVDGRLLLIVVALIALALFGILLNQGTLPHAVLLWWPSVIVLFAALWMVRSLAQRASAGLLGSTALFGIALSLLLASAYQVPLSETLIGVALIAVGMGIVLRGLLWRSAPAR